MGANSEISKYLESLNTVGLIGVLGDVRRETLELEMPTVRNDTLSVLRVILEIIKPAKILEIGCASGFSAGFFTGYLPEGEKVVTIDRYPYMIEIARQNFTRLGIEDNVELLEGDAADILPKLEGKFDFIFLDAAKAQYVNYLPHCLRLLRRGGILVADDVLLSGYIAEKALNIPRRHRTARKRMNSFLEAICGREGLATTILPVGGGLSVTVKKY